jgi:hypothetical protein
MANIKSIPEALLERIDECVNKVTKDFSDSVRPIYGSNDQGRPVHIGSCVLLMLGEAPVLLTAAHLLDESSRSTLYIGGEKSLVQLDGDFFTSSKPGGSRANDHYDFAAHKLSSQAVSELGAVKYVQQKESSSNKDDTVGHVFLLLGYPNTKNRVIGTKENCVRPQLWKYWSTHKPSPSLTSKLKISGNEHYFIDFNKKQSSDALGAVVNSISPRGVSGGALVDMGNIASLSKLDASAHCQGHLAGLAIEFHASYCAIVATHIQVILQGLRAHGF